LSRIAWLIFPRMDLYTWIPGAERVLPVLP